MPMNMKTKMKTLVSAAVGLAMIVGLSNGHAARSHEACAAAVSRARCAGERRTRAVRMSEAEGWPAVVFAVC
jgi:hypothetical protein